MSEHQFTDPTGATQHEPLHSGTASNSKNRAFTLVELLVVIATIALLSSMLLPAMSGTKQNTMSTLCLGNLRQLQMAWAMYSDDNNDYIVGNNWQEQVSRVPNVGNWVSGRLDPIRDRVFDNTNTSLLLDPKYGALGPYTKKAALYKCAASKTLVKEGTNSYPLVRTVSMNSWMGFRTMPFNTGGFGYRTFRRKSEIASISPSSALVFVEERDDSIDDGEFIVDMDRNWIVNGPASTHGGFGGLTFADGHAEMHRWRSRELQIPQQLRVTRKWEFVSVSVTNIDMLWLCAHSTVRLW